jgi:hypothetical protein
MICPICNKSFKSGEHLVGWDNYDDMWYPDGFIYKDDRQPEIMFGSEIQHKECT